ncbi:unnamed protein product [marine sediment metagenome]|uniref:Uncharacterized protein n=1 Tax=marine sediment metagenome TaxID=412755 RepID=X0XWI8_9ZZZZ
MKLEKLEIENQLQLESKMEELEKEMQIILQHIEKVKPLNIIANATNFNFTVIQKIQNWIVKNFIGKAMEFGIQKYAIIFSEKLLAEVSEERIEKDEDESFLIQYFDNKEKAEQWMVE